MPLEGLRAWIGELERKLGARTRVGLVLVALAFGAGGAGIYLARDAADNSISKDDLQALEEQLQLSAGATSATPEASQIEAVESQASDASSQVAELKREVEELKEEVEELQPGGSKPGSASGEEKDAGETPK
jgi:uncharacterized protein HemX